MSRLTTLIICCLPFANAFADVNQETFEHCADGFNSQDCNHINEADQRFRGIEGSLAGIEQELANLPPRQPRWVVVEYNESTGELTELADVIVDQYPYNRINSINVASVMVKYRDDHPLGANWVPGLFTTNNGQLTLSRQGLESVTGVLAWPANSGCAGEPIAIIAKNHPAAGLRSYPENIEVDASATAPYSRPSYWHLAYDYRNGKLYRFSTEGGSASSDQYYDLLEYGFDDGFLPNAYGCQQNVHLESRTDISYSGIALILNDPVVLFVNPYANFNYDRIFSIMFR
jgi:hypothetical protein